MISLARLGSGVRRPSSEVPAVAARALVPWTVVLATVGLLACGGAADGGVPPSRQDSPATADTTDTTAAIRDTGQETTASGPVFDGVRAMEHLEVVVGFGPRPAGSEALERTRGYIADQVESHGLELRRDGFTAQTPAGAIGMVNLIVEVPAATGAAEGPVIIISGHYDTAGGEFTRGFEFVGANDAGSSTAVLVEMARALSVEPPPLPVWLVFFDGEEAVVRWQGDDNTYGSRYMAQRLRDEGRVDEFGAMILVDMVGDADLGLTREWNSTPWLLEMVWQTADELGHGEHFLETGTPIMDDHLPFLEIGVPVIDLIDFDYGPGNRYWHSPFDTLDKVAPESLEVVGDVVMATLPKLAERFADR